MASASRKGQEGLWDSHWCFQCYGINRGASGPCDHCGGEISPPPGISFEEQLIWTLGHPDGDRAILAARTLGVRRAKSAAPRLRELATSSGDVFLAVESLRSLVLIEGAEELRPLLTHLSARGSFLLEAAAREALASSPNEGQG